MNEKRKNILIISYNNLGIGGVQFLISKIVNLSRFQLTFDIVVFEDKPIMYKSFAENSCNVFKIPLPERKSIMQKIFWVVFKKDRYIKEQFSILFKKKHYDIVHSFKEFDSYSIFKAAKKNKINKRILHVNVIHKRPNNIIHRIIWMKRKKATVSMATDIVCVSNACKTSLFPNKSNSNVMVLHNPYEEGAYYVREKCQKGKTLTMLHVASFSSNKNQLFSLSVFNEIVKRHSNSFLIFIGHENEKGYLKKMNNYIANNDLFDKVTFRNKTTNQILGKTTCYILPSISEGASIVSIEAQASGIPVFSSTALSDELNCGGLIKINLSTPPEQWANIIVSDFLKRKGKRTQYIMDDFSTQKFESKLLSIYGCQQC